MKQNDETRRVGFSFAAIDTYVETNIVLPTEKVISGRDMVQWGTKNVYPDYLLDLYNNVPTLRSIINGNIDYVAGDEISIVPLQEEYTNQQMNRRGDTIREQVKDIAKDFEIYGGFALQVIRNLAGEVAEIYYIDMRFLRTNKEGNVFYYSEKWNKGGRTDVIIYPAFMPNLDWESLTDEEKNRHASSILFVKNVHTQVYPAPLYAASVKACEIERQIDDFHLSDINNHFVSSAIINFNNGDPGDEMKKEVEATLNEKFSGAVNGGRIMCSWNKNRESATDIREFKVEDFGERYKSLSQHSRTQIFTAFRAIPLLFGLTSEANTGFSTEEFEQSFKLYNRTQIKPVQDMICGAYERIYGKMGVLSIKPFSLSGETEEIVN
ncbi:MAG: hypothetical protein IKY16_02915 [Bacteroidales bacterium]|nr:hypothetical protein [Bacteroidales bacterium]MBR5013540.1 hypothetical protein [Bacteroidales bacterium]